MSDRALYPTRLYWDAHAGRGVARHEGVEVILHRAPNVMMSVAHIDMLEYAPGLHVFVAQERGQPKRDLREWEVIEIKTALEQMAARERKHWGQS